MCAMDAIEVVFRRNASSQRPKMISQRSHRVKQRRIPDKTHSQRTRHDMSRGADLGNSTPAPVDDYAEPQGRQFIFTGIE